MNIRLEQYLQEYKIPEKINIITNRKLYAQTSYRQLNCTQKKMFQHLCNNKRAMCISGRQTGKTEVLIRYLTCLDKLLFDKRILFLVPTAEHRDDIMRRLSDIGTPMNNYINVTADLRNTHGLRYDYLVCDEYNSFSTEYKEDIKQLIADIENVAMATSSYSVVTDSISFNLSIKCFLTVDEIRNEFDTTMEIDNIANTMAIDISRIMSGLIGQPHTGTSFAQDVLIRYFTSTSTSGVF